MSIGEAVFNTTTITEMKNSGSLRLIGNRKIVDEMADYYERKTFAAKKLMPTKEQIYAMQNIKNEIFSLLDLDEYVESFQAINSTSYKAIYNFEDIRNHTSALKPKTVDPKQFEKLFTQMGLMEIQVMKYNFWLRHCKEAAKSLIDKIEKEYHLPKTQG